ncbi:hypothetical protein ART_3612 [Arthrobacter sp. PAMC 25486]|nr:hypothetical protein ART_3612 [Arthrobacter sp. PAMC 25486]
MGACGAGLRVSAGSGESRNRQTSPETRAERCGTALSGRGPAAVGLPVQYRVDQVR